MKPTITAPLFPAGGGRAGEQIARQDWRAHPLGPAAGWASSFRSALDLTLHSGFPACLIWSGELFGFWNDAFALLAGEDADAAPGKNFADAWPGAWKAISALVDKAFSGNAVPVKEVSLPRPQSARGDRVQVSFSCVPVRGEQGEVCGVMCIGVEAKASSSETHAHAGDGRLLQLFAQAPGLIAIRRGPDHVFEFANEAYLRLVQRDVIGKPMREVFPELEKQGVIGMLDQIYRTGKAERRNAYPASFRSSPDGPLEERFFDFIQQPIFDEDGKVTGILAAGFDVTDTVRTTAALQKAESWLQEGLLTGRMAVWEMDLKTWDVRYSTHAEKVLGYATTNVMQNLDHVHPEDRDGVRDALKRAIEERGIFHFTSRRVAKADGAITWMEQRGKVHLDDQGEPVSMTGVNIDVTDRVNAELQLKEANRRKDEFLAMLAHELRNPLAPISTAAQLLQLSAHDPQRVRQASEIITRQVRHMTELMNDLLDVSRVTRGLVQLEMEALDLKSVASNAIEQVRPLIEARRHVLNVRIEADLASVRGDRTRLTQIVSNLLNNAAKYTPPGGEITLRVGVWGGRVAIEVADNGIGIGKELLPHVFDLFTQAERTPDRSQGGLGIGLALVKSIVQLHGGNVAAFSAGQNKGSTFIVTLPPAAGEAQDRRATEQPARPSAAKPLQVMVVDDNADAAHSLAALLEAEGHRITVKENATDALAAAEQSPHEVFILDIGLPDMDGRALARRLRGQATSSRALFIALSGYGQPQDKAMSKESGFDHHFVKPLDTQRLFDLFSQL